MKNTRFSLPLGGVERTAAYEGGVDEAGERNRNSGLNRNNINISHDNNINDIVINQGTSNNIHTHTHSTFASTFPRNMRPTSAQPALPSASTHFNANTHFSTTTNFKSGIDPRSFPFMSGSRSENLIEIPPSLTGTMPPRKFSAQLKKKSFLVEKKGMEMLPYRGLDARARLGS